MATRAHLSLIDYGRETGGVSWLMGDITTLNFDARLTEIDDMVSAIEGVTLGNRIGHGFTLSFTGLPTPPTDEHAQRETKWLVSYRDTTEFLDVAGTIQNHGYGKVFTMEIPTADETLLRPNSEELDTGPGTAGEALVQAIEANVRGPYSWGAANPSIEVISVKRVSRNT